MEKAGRRGVATIRRVQDVRRLVAVTLSRLVEKTMNTIATASSLVLGAALLAGCTERSTPTGMTEKPGVGLSADATGANISVVLDPVGDVVSKGNDYQDIVRAETAKQGRDFAFVMELAAAVPDNPLLPSGADVIDWVLGLDTDPAP